MYTEGSGLERWGGFQINITLRGSEGKFFFSVFKLWFTNNFF